MRNLALAVTALAFTGSTHAADLPRNVPASVAPPALAPLPTWTSCYIGANIGGASGHLRFTQIGKVNGIPLNNDFDGQSGSSVVGGGQLGCDYQVSYWVFGIQGLGDIADLDGSNVVPASPMFSIHNLNEWFATATGRVGYTVMPSLLLYGRGGAAFIQDELNVSSATRSFLETATANRTGWTAGGGLEWMYVPNVSLFVEYMHMDFGTKNIAFTTGVGTVGLADVIATKHSIDTIMIGANWRFWPLAR